MDPIGWRRLDGRSLMPILLLMCGAGCGSGNPFPQDQVNGWVTYSDGTLIPAEMIILKFEPLAEPIDAKTFPPAGMGYVNVKDGSFDVVTSYRYGDGLVRGKHRVLVVATDASGGVTNLVPPEYTDSKLTPLMIDTVDAPFNLRVRKP